MPKMQCADQTNFASRENISMKMEETREMNAQQWKLLPTLKGATITYSLSVLQ
jgi:hypothetical protein